MKEAAYRNFSLKTHKKNWFLKRPNVCELELTFGCGLHCKYCYTDCFNQNRYLKKELNTKEVKFILDKLYQAGVLWLCFTGGDPLTRPDFLKLYSYAKDRGFIITIFTNGYSMIEEIAAYLQKRPPFVLEITLNAVRRDLYEKISALKGSFNRVMQGIDLILKYSLPLKIKTQVIKDNFKELPQIKKFIQGLGLKFRPSILLHTRLNTDPTPCNLRTSIQDVLSMNGKRPRIDDGCRISLKNKDALFSCAIGGGDSIKIDPYGNVVPCNCIREPKVNLLKKEIEEARQELLRWVRTQQFTRDKECRDCSLRAICFNCPGKAWLEKGSLGARIDWFCALAHTYKKNASH